MKLCRVFLFIPIFLALGGMKAAPTERVARPFHRVVEAIYIAIPDTQTLVKKSLSEFIKLYNNKKSEGFEAPEFAWLFLKEWLEENIPLSTNTEHWKLEVLDIYNYNIDYKIYLR